MRRRILIGGTLGGVGAWLAKPLTALGMPLARPDGTRWLLFRVGEDRREIRDFLWSDEGKYWIERNSLKRCYAVAIRDDNWVYVWRYVTDADGSIKTTGKVKWAEGMTPEEWEASIRSVKLVKEWKGFPLFDPPPADWWRKFAVGQYQFEEFSREQDATLTE